MIFFSIIQFAASSLFWGVLMAAALVTLLVLIVRSCWKDAQFTVWTYVATVVLGILLTYECTMMIGAQKFRSTCDDLESTITEIVSHYYPDNLQEVSKEKTTEIVHEITEQYPFLSNYMTALTENDDVNGSSNISEGFSAADLPGRIISYLKDMATDFMMCRIYWGIGFLVVFSILTILTLNKQTGRTMRGRDVARSDRYSGRSTQRVKRDLRHVSRRH